MLARMRSGLTYANVMATVAMFLAVGGGAYAAMNLPKNSVGATQIKANAVSSAKVRDRSLLASDFKAGQLPSGVRGPKGDTGVQGVPGPKGDTGVQGVPGLNGAPGGATNVVVRSMTFDISGGGGFSASLPCAAGERAVSGGAGRSNGFSSLEDQISTSVATNALTGLPTNSGSTPTAWTISFHYTGVGTFQEIASVVCVGP